MDAERYRRGSLGDLIELVVDGWEIIGLHYADTCGTVAHPDSRPAAFIELHRADSGVQGLFIPDDERTYSHRALLGLVREAPHIRKHRTSAVIHERLQELELEYSRRPEPEVWDNVADPADIPMEVTPQALRGVVALGYVEAIGEVTVALLSLERFRDFSRIRYLAHTSDAMRRGGLAALDVFAVDDRGRRYRSASLGVERSGSRLEGVIALAPGIPRDATALTVTIGTIGHAGPDGAIGPWVFPIRLPTPGIG